MIELNKIYNMDCVDGMKLLDNNSIDLTVTSPPYDKLRTYDGFTWNFEATAKELFRVTKDGGVVVWVVSDSTVNGSETGTSFKQALYFKSIGFNLHDTMIWEKTGRLPTQDRYYNIFEYMFVFSKGKPKEMNFICDSKTVNGGKVQKKDTCINKGKHEYGDGTFIRNEFARRPNIWKIHIGKNTTKHPAIFPESLANDHILTWSNEGDTVLDCFMGSGTTAKMSILNKRNFIGFEISKKYCDMANERINK